MLKQSAALAGVLLTGICAATAQTGSNIYLQTNLVANVAGVAPVTDPNLVDPWGISESSGSPFWVSNHLSGTSTLYSSTGAIVPLVVTIPAGSASTGKGRPTGQVFNSASPAFQLANGKAASFIFATEDGTIAAWNGGAAATIMVDNSGTNAVYKGLAIGTSASGPALYAANFRSGKIDVFNSTWAPATLAGSFTDPGVPSGFAPFNIVNLRGSLYVAYAKQDSNKFLDVAGAGNGYISVFDLNGNLLSDLVAGGPLNSPWGLAIAPADWGAFGGDLLVGNFGDGKINAFDSKTGSTKGTLNDMSGSPIAISGLWALIFGNGGRGGDVNTLYFAAGVPNGGTVPRGILGSIAPPAAIKTIVNAASQLTVPVSPGEIVAINGQSLGPSPLVAATIPTTGTLGTTLAGTSVTFNGIAAPILFTNGNETSVQVPYALTGSTATVVLKAGGQTTAAFQVQTAPTAPGLFTSDFSGKGQLVALNSDGTVNSAKNPAAKGSAILLFATGEGLTNPPGVDGLVQGDFVREPIAAVTVMIGGAGAQVIYAGSTFGDVAGVMEIELIVPAGTTPGSAVPVSLTVGGVTTTTASTIAVM